MNMETFLNFTTHAITLNDGRVFESAGVARVANTFSDFDSCGVSSVPGFVRKSCSLSGVFLVCFPWQQN